MGLPGYEVLEDVKLGSWERIAEESPARPFFKTTFSANADLPFQTPERFRRYLWLVQPPREAKPVAIFRVAVHRHDGGCVLWLVAADEDTVRGARQDGCKGGGFGHEQEQAQTEFARGILGIVRPSLLLTGASQACCTINNIDMDELFQRMQQTVDDVNWEQRRIQRPPIHTLIGVSYRDLEAACTSKFVRFLDRWNRTTKRQ
ncbi:hypothetical protein BC937DRAFT_88567 [Endogone sp. FLAS-F59071]|nr:hypothetical protein BC937DRAFT_88567 [Endogone sp. FLAS-F59071]|eukprot:RUS22536.1 hypothetical protein BC937DRAFT_88567 [Endogone sp. FLAS-F59071]